MIYTMCIHSKAKVFASTRRALQDGFTAVGRSDVCLQLREFFINSAGGVTDMGPVEIRSRLV
jgi:hypothetical protein